MIEFIKYFGSLLFTLVTLSSFSQPQSDGLKLIEREQIQRGIVALTSAAESQPSAMNWYRLGFGLSETGDLKASQSAFDKGISLDAKSALNYAGKGRAFLREGNMMQATAQFDKALDLTKSKDVAAMNAVARAWLEKTDLAPKGLELLKKTDGNTPNFETSILLGDAFLQQGNGGSAITNYEHAATFEVRNPTPHFKIGVVYIRSTNKDAALDAFTKAVSIDPDYAPAWKEIAELQYQFKKGEEAVKAQEKYLALTDFKDAGLSRMGYYRFMAKDFAKASEAFRAAWKKSLLSETGLKYFALALTETGEYQEAQKVFEEYFQTAKPEQVEAPDHVAYGKLLLKLDQDSLAVGAFDKSLAIADNQSSVKQLKAETLFKSRRYAEASVAYKDLISNRQKPTSQDLYSLGRSQYYNGAFLQADTTFRNLIAAQPAMNVGYLWAARTNASLDPESEGGMAKPFYEKVIELGQATPDKSKNELKEAFSYMGYYFYIKKDMRQSKAAWEKVLAIDPNDKAATEAMKVVKVN